MSIIWVEENQPLPLASQVDTNGLVAAGLDLSPKRLMEAYSKGLFPWFSPGDPVLWWSPNPRMVLNCRDLYISHSLAKRIRQFDRSDSRFISLNMGFNTVIKSCANRNDSRLGLADSQQIKELAPLSQQSHNNTWITPEIQEVYTAWHYMSHVHSVEAWVDNKIVGGLYGVSIGKCFFGESMFSYVTDTSKIALAYLVAYLLRQGVEWIDCQQETPHLASLGAQAIDRSEFMARLAAGLSLKQTKWGQGRLRANGNLEAIHE